MKWFKHLSAARDDERIAQLEDIAGLEGYGFYFKLLEIVAASMDGTDRCEIGYSVSRWASLTNCHPIKARTLVGKVASCGLVEQRLEDGRLVVRITKLLKHRDNHTKNLQVACKQEEEKEKEEEKDKPALSLAPKEKTPKKRDCPLPTDFAISERVRGWAAAKGYAGGALQSHFENFILQAAAKGYTYTDWDSALIKAIAADWAKVGKGGRRLAI